MGPRRASTIVVALTLAAFCLGGCEKPRTGPDLSNPKAAAVTFTKALEDGDIATARLASNAGGIEQNLIEAMAQSASGIKRLNASATAKFGEDAKKLVQQHGAVNVARNLAEGDVEQGADRATVRSKDGRDTIQLLKIDGVWKVDVGALIKGKDITQVVPFFRAAGLAARQVADDIDAGRCTTVEETRKAMMAKIFASLPQMMREEVIPSSKPAQDDLFQ